MTIYTTGTVSVTAGSAIVTGSGTAWNLSLVQGGLFSCDGLSVPILQVDSDTQLTIAYPWPGTTGSGKVYAIDRQSAAAASAIDANDRLALIVSKLLVSPYLNQAVSGPDTLLYGSDADQVSETAFTASARALVNLAGVPAANKLPYLNSDAGAALTDLTASARALLAGADAAAMRGVLVAVGKTNVEAITGRKQLKTGATGDSGMANNTGSLGEAEVAGNGTGAAMMAFHRIGAFAGYFGLDTDNKWKVGGWSMGNNAHDLWHNGNAVMVSTSNGIAWRFPNGLQLCRSPELTLTYGSSARLSTTWTFPAPFSGSCNVSGAMVNLGTLAAANQDIAEWVDSTTHSQTRVSFINGSVFSSGDSATGRFFAIGEWS